MDGGYGGGEKKKENELKGGTGARSVSDEGDVIDNGYKSMFLKKLEIS